MGERARRGARAGLLLALGLLALFVATLPWTAASLVDRALRQELAARGIDRVHIGDVRVGLGEAVVEDLVLGEGEDVLRVRAVRAEYAPGELLRGRIGRVRLEGVRARERLAEGGPPGALDALTRSALGGGGGGGAPPFRAIEVSDLRLAVQVGDLEIVFTVEGQLARRDDQWLGALEGHIDSEGERLRGEVLLRAEPPALALDLSATGDALALPGASAVNFALSLEGSLASERFEGAIALEAAAQTAAGPMSLSLPGRLRLDLDTRQLTLDAPPADAPADARRDSAAAATPASGGTAAAQSALVLSDFDLRLAGLSGVLDLGGDPPALRIRASRVVDLAEPPRLPRLALDVTLTRAPDGAVTARGVLAGAAERIALRFDTTWSAADDAVSVALTLPPVRFEEGGLQPDDLIPWLPEIAATAGTLAAQGRLVWEEAGLRSDLRLALEGLAGEAAGVAFVGLDAALHLTQPWPPATPPGQTLEVERATLGLDAEDVAVRFALQPPGVFDVASARGSLLEGVVRTQGRFDPALARNELVLDVSRVDLAALAQALDLGGLTASGTLSGRIPLALRADGVFVEGGELAADEPGALRYRPGAGVGVPADDPRMGLLLDALRDFRYDQLRITLAGAVAGDLDIRLHLAGSSPDFYEGHPVELNLNLEAPIAALLQGLEVEALPDRILREIRQRELPQAEPPQADGEAR